MGFFLNNDEDGSVGSTIITDEPSKSLFNISSSSKLSRLDWPGDLVRIRFLTSCDICVTCSCLSISFSLKISPTNSGFDCFTISLTSSPFSNTFVLNNLVSSVQRS